MIKKFGFLHDPFFDAPHPPNEGRMCLVETKNILKDSYYYNDTVNNQLTINSAIQPNALLRTLESKRLGIQSWMKRGEQNKSIKMVQPIARSDDSSFDILVHYNDGFAIWDPIADSIHNLSPTIEVGEDVLFCHCARFGVNDEGNYKQKFMAITRQGFLYSHHLDPRSSVILAAPPTPTVRARISKKKISSVDLLPIDEQRYLLLIGDGSTVKFFALTLENVAEMVGEYKSEHINNAFAVKSTNHPDRFTFYMQRAGSSLYFVDFKIRSSAPRNKLQLKFWDGEDIAFSFSRAIRSVCKRFIACEEEGLDGSVFIFNLYTRKSVALSLNLRLVDALVVDEYDRIKMIHDGIPKTEFSLTSLSPWIRPMPKFKFEFNHCFDVTSEFPPSYSTNFDIFSRILVGRVMDLPIPVPPTDWKQLRLLFDHILSALSSWCESSILVLYLLQAHRSDIERFCDNYQIPFYLQMESKLLYSLDSSEQDAAASKRLFSLCPFKLLFIDFVQGKCRDHIDRPIIEPINMSGAQMRLIPSPPNTPPPNRKYKKSPTSKHKASKSKLQTEIESSTDDAENSEKVDPSRFLSVDMAMDIDELMSNSHAFTPPPIDLSNVTVSRGGGRGRDQKAVETPARKLKRKSSTEQSKLRKSPRLKKKMEELENQ